MNSTLKTYFKLFRVNNYIKNVFIFAPLFFVLKFDIETLLYTGVAFMLFNFLASSVYIMNDIFDLKSDRQHPIKRHRPIATNTISVNRATILSILLLAISLLGGYSLNRSTLIFFIGYVLMNVLYNLILKKIPILDVGVLAIGFVIRVMVGARVNHIPASSWILIMTFLLALFLGFSKRRADFLITEQIGYQYSNLKIYSLKTLQYIVIFIGIIICVSYFVYSISNEVAERWNSKFIVVTTIWVVLGIWRYLQIIFKAKEYHTPTSIVIKDLTLNLIMLAWGATFLIIYFFNF